MQALPDYRFFENGLPETACFITVLLLGFGLKKVLSKLLAGLAFRYLRRNIPEVNPEEFRNLVRGPVEFFLIVGVLAGAFSFLHFPNSWNLVSGENFGLRMIILRGFMLATIAAGTWLLLRLTDFLGLVSARRLSVTESRIAWRLHPFMVEALKVMVFLISVCITLGSVFNLNITGIITGLGIGGLAVALAGKETLENLFAGFTIFIDQPFMVGDLVQTKDIKGTVERVGFRSTRIRTIDRSFVTLPNKLLVDQAVDNLTMRAAMRVRFGFNLPFHTPLDRVKNITTTLQVFLNSHPSIGGSNDALVGFYEFDENSLRISVLYYINTLDFVESSRIKEEVNYRILQIVTENEAAFHVVQTALIR